MPRQARRKSNSNIYHVMLRGINRQDIFECKGDYLYFIEVLRRIKGKCDFKLYAYCLMGNHVHLLMGCQNDDVSECVKRIAVSYSYYFNCKNKRIGHLFQDRFKSEPVEDDRYFVGVIRYIHMNPVKAGICSKPEQYAWSSYLEYLKNCGFRIGKTPAEPITDTDMLLEMFGPNEFTSFTKAPNDDAYLEIADKPRISMTDDVARSMMKEQFGIDTAMFVRAMDRHGQREVIQFLFNGGANVAQISRLTGISRPTILRALHGDGSA